MKLGWRLPALIIALAFLGLTILNASWLAPDPVGGPRLIALGGITQEYDRAALSEDDCAATAIEAPMHDYIEQTARSISRAGAHTAQMVEVDVQMTADGEIVLFADKALDCRTNGTGLVRETTLEELEALDIGYGYTADGETFPLRGGRGVGAIATLEEALVALQRQPFLFHLPSEDLAKADTLAAKLKASGRRVERIGDSFYGHPQAVARMREHFPENWAFDFASAERCTHEYTALGWSGWMPGSCKDGTMLITLDEQGLLWGWPNRLIARAEANNTRLLVMGPRDESRPHEGLWLPEQFGEIPSTYNGFVWIEDLWTLAPALRPSQDRRRYEEQLASVEAVEARQKRMAER